MKTLKTLLAWTVREPGQAVRPPNSSPRRAARRLAVEWLEGRLAPASLTVNSTADTANPTDSYLSLREAIAIVNSPSLPGDLSPQIQTQISGTLHGGGADAIGFDPAGVTGPIVLGGTQLELSLPASTAAVTINGGTAGVTVDGNNASRVFQVDSGVQATLDHLTITHGNVTDTSLSDVGGGILNNGGTLTVSSSTFSANTARFDGGGVANESGTATVSNSTLSANSASYGFGGGIYNSGILTVTNSTLSANTGGGGGIYNSDSDTGSATATVSNSTLSANSGGGIRNDGGSLTVSNSTITANQEAGIEVFGGTLQLRNTIVAGNHRDSGPEDIDGPVDSSSSYNLVGSAGATLSGISNGLGGNLVGAAGSPIDPRLGPLADNGGPTLTNALLPDSPARGAGSLAFATATDQRGFPRTVGGEIDLGAFQTPSVAGPRVVVSDPDGVVDPPVDHARLTFNHPLDPATVTPAQFTLTGPAGAIPVTGVTAIGSSGGQQFDVLFASQSAPGDYTLTVGTGVHDTHGTPPAGPLTARFILPGLTGSTLTVNSTLDTASDADPYLTLREAIALVNSPTLPTDLSPQILAQISGTLHAHGSDVIVFDPLQVSGPIFLGGTPLEVSLLRRTARVMIDGGQGVTVGGNNLSSVFQMDLGVQATLDHLTITHANETVSSGYSVGNSGMLTVSNSTLSANSGGGIYNLYGTLTVSNSTLSANSGGGIDNSYGTATVTNSTVSNNFVSLYSSGGGLYNYGGTLTVSNSTITANYAGAYGGGIYNYDGRLTVSNSTITANFAHGGRGGGIFNADTPGGTLLVQDSIVAGNQGGGTPNIDGSYTQSYSLVGGNPLLSPLGYYGGPTQTFALLPGSPARGAGDPNDPETTDQRGLPRLVGGQTDIGAFQSQANPFLVTTLTDPGRQFGQLSLREALNLASVLPGSNTVSFDTSLASGTITLTAGELLLSRSVTITGPSGGLTVSGNNASRVFEVAAGVTANLSGLTIANGLVSSSSMARGGGILNAGSLSLTDCTLSNNQAAVSLTGTGSEDVSAQGGGIASTGSLSLIRCTLSGNSATLAAGNLDYGQVNGGGLYANGTMVSLTNSTVSGNSSVAMFGGGSGLVFAYGGGLTADSTTLNLSGCTVSGNSASGDNGAGQGGGLHAYQSTVTLTTCTVSNNTAASTTGSALGGGLSAVGGSLTLTASMVTNNQASINLLGTGVEDVFAQGGGLYANGGMVGLTGSTVSGNAAVLAAGNLDYGNANGGGLYGNGGTVALTNSTVAGNSATASFSGGNGLVFGYGGGLTCDSGTLNLSGCTVSGNTASGSNGDGYGGGIHGYQGSVTLTNCTVANNTAGSASGSGYGGGLSDLGGSFTLTSCTVSGNTAASSAGSGSGGGLFYDGSAGVFQLDNTIVAGNSAATAGSDANGGFTSLGYNLIGISDGSSGWGGSDLTGTAASPLDPGLGTLSDNGGPTQTMALLDGSPARGAGDPGLLGTADQRGVARTGAVDIGAFQATSG
jgi:hypothetical protein